MEDELNISESLLKALQQLLKSYKEQSEQSSNLLKDNQQITTDLKSLKLSSQKKIEDTQEVCDRQEVINSKIEQLSKELAAVQSPKRPIALNGWVLAIAAVCLGLTVWIGITKIFDYDVAKAAAEATAEKTVFNNIMEHNYYFPKTDYTKKEKDGWVEMIPKK